jgi:hypothetical protein
MVLLDGGPCAKSRLLHSVRHHGPMGSVLWHNGQAKTYEIGLPEFGRYFQILMHSAHKTCPFVHAPIAPRLQNFLEQMVHPLRGLAFTTTSG